MSHPCPITGCTTILADSLILCGSHHRLVPEHLAATLLSKWNTLQRMKRGQNSKLLLRAAKEYAEALGAVVAWVNRQVEGVGV